MASKKEGEGVRIMKPAMDDIQLDEEGPQATKTLVVCICPKCGKRHRLSFFWTGKGTPRKFCMSCKNSHYQ